MAFNLSLPVSLRNTRWKVKIRDKETREPPHATIIRGTDSWRIDLRTKKFLDANPDPAVIPNELIDFITEEGHWTTLCARWDQMYPNNPVSGMDIDEE